ncbi:MAG: hypothetical protein MR446_05865, partial [Bacteroidales bacterium]|nr:hypothetical protein [Bacteroidales bacterium]
TQHVCEIMKLAPRSVNMLRYRLRRKFGLSSGHSLEEAILLFQQPDFKLPPEGMGAAMAERKTIQGSVTDSEECIPWEKHTPPWKKVPTPWEVSSTAACFYGPPPRRK